MDKHTNKFHNMSFKTDTSHEASLVTSLGKGLENERINDDFSNEDLIKFRHPQETENSKNILINAIKQSDSKNNY